MHSWHDFYGTFAYYKFCSTTVQLMIQCLHGCNCVSLQAVHKASQRYQTAVKAFISLAVKKVINPLDLQGHQPT